MEFSRGLCRHAPGPGTAGRNADPSTALRSGRDDKGREVTQVGVVAGWNSLKLSPDEKSSSHAGSVGMRQAQEPQGALQIPPLRSPDFLSGTVALMDPVRLSLRRAAYVAVAGIAK
jgi:hypothetical protein